MTCEDAQLVFAIGYCIRTYEVQGSSSVLSDVVESLCSSERYDALTT
jgi:hypothetical protein